MHSKTLANWRAKRAGGRITVYGDEVVRGHTVNTKIVGIDTITPGMFHEGACYATDKDGITHKLVLN